MARWFENEQLYAVTIIAVVVIHVLVPKWIWHRKWSYLSYLSKFIQLWKSFHLLFSLMLRLAKLPKYMNWICMWWVSKWERVVNGFLLFSSLEKYENNFDTYVLVHGVHIYEFYKISYELAQKIVQNGWTFVFRVNFR